MEPSKGNQNDHHSPLTKSENAGRPENEPTGREKLNVGGRMVIPERWGKEDLLKDWIDYSAFDALLAPKEAALAREALARRGSKS